MRDYGSLYIKVGFFVFITLLIFFIGIFIISGEQKFFEKEYNVRTYFNNTVGLLPGAYVRLSGVRVGTVSKINFPNNKNKNLIEVTMSVNKNGADRITPDSQNKIIHQGEIPDVMNNNQLEDVSEKLNIFIALLCRVFLRTLNYQGMYYDIYHKTSKII